MTRILIISIILISLGLPDCRSEEVRIALIVGNNDGGEDVTSLRYAEKDAENIHAVFRNYGGFEPKNLHLLLGGDASHLDQILAEIGARIQHEKKKRNDVLFLFYYTGHSTQRNLKLNGTVYPFSTLKAKIADLGADIRIVFLDSCYSGIFLKGGTTFLESQMIIADDDGNSGDIIIASSTFLEPSMESEDLQSSYFTYFLIGALRGEGDSTRDGRVSIREAYQYVYDNTLLRTSGENVKLQHPRFSYQYKGSGEIILTDLRKADSLLILPKFSSGRHLIYDRQKGYIVLEVNKLAGMEHRVAIEEGDYIVRKIGKEKVLETEIHLGQNERKIVDFIMAKLYPLQAYLMKRSLDGISYHQFFLIDYAYYHFFDARYQFHLLKLGFEQEINLFSFVNSLLFPLPSFRSEMIMIEGIGFESELLLRKTIGVPIFGRQRSLGLFTGLGVTGLYQSLANLDYDDLVTIYYDENIANEGIIYIMPSSNTGLKLYLRKRTYLGLKIELGNRFNPESDKLFKLYFSTGLGLTFTL